MASPESPARDALGALLDDLFSDVRGQPDKQPDKQPAEQPADSDGAGERKPKPPTPNGPSHKPAASHKRLRSASAHDAVPLKDGSARDHPLPLLLLVPRDDPNGRHGGRRGDREAAADAHDQRRCKMPRLGAHAAWLMAPGLTADEKRLALPLLFNERLPYEPEADGSVFAALERSVCSQLSRLDAVFQTEGLSPSVTSTRRFAVEPSGEHGPFVKFVSAKLLPFSFEVITDTVRQLAIQTATHAGDADKTSSNTVYSKQRYYLRPDELADSIGVPLLLRCAFLHAIEDDRMLGAWSGTGEWPEEMATDQTASAPIREQGWMLVQRCPAQPAGRKARPATSPSQCLVQSCLYVTPGLSDNAIRDDKGYLDILSTVTAPSFQKLIDEREQILENRFMDRMLQARVQPRTRPPGYSRSSSL